MSDDYQTGTDLSHDKLAWQNALSLRACPPDRILFGEMTPLLAKHVRGCHLCQENLEYQEITVLTWPEIELLPGRTDTFEPGQVRLISNKLAGWGPKNRYFNPPLVLILKCLDAHACLVAQMYPGNDFMSPLDVSIDDLGYVEPWNTYTMGCQDLEEPMGVHPEVVPLVMERSREDFNNLPAGYFHDFFYTLEIELGSFFSQLSLAQIMSRHYSGILNNPEQFRSALKSSGYRLPSVEPPDLLLEIAKTTPDLFNAGKAISMVTFRDGAEMAPSEPPRSVLRMAASGRKNLRANVVLQHGSELSIDTVLFTVTACEPEPENRLFVAGEFASCVYAFQEIMAWWETDNRFIPSVKQEFSPDNRFFQLLFEGITREMALRGSPVLLLSARTR